MSNPQYKYEIATVGEKPSFNQNAFECFINPVSIGEKVKSNKIGSELRKVVEIEHYNSFSVLYVEQKALSLKEIQSKF